ncbi:MAG: carboxylating nicotinate-nucleotide diphosphorylase [Deltaproteobacteria bacterium]|nr:carboxylating nicotinate-nucleotide diphosphorylase [Deltaproteobacteria bacterium]
MSRAKKELIEYATLLAKAALAEDLLGGVDLTTSAIVDKKEKSTFEVIAKEELIVCGLFVLKAVINEVDKNLTFKALKKDGELARKGTLIGLIKGSLSSMLIAERVALNFLQHLSGVATLTSKYVKKTTGTQAKIFDTRKTTPLLRALEKYAVKIGGGSNHRFGLFDAILIKDNHIRAGHGITGAVLKAQRTYPKQKIEVEVKNLAELKEALSTTAKIIMLDNMTVSNIKKAVILAKKIKPKIILEASGGVTLKTISAIARTGVDRISVGALTHSAPSSDISMLEITGKIKK